MMNMQTVDRQRTVLIWAVTLLVAAVIPLVLPVVARAQESRADLSGQWILNEDESDDPQEAMQAQRGGRGGMQDRGDRVGGGLGMEGMRGAMARAMKGPTQLRLTVEAAQVTIETVEGESLVLPTNGDEVETMVNGRVVEMEATWDDRKLKVERRIEGGVRITETYARAPQSPRMNVTVLVEGPRAVTSFKRVYDRAADPVGS